MARGGPEVADIFRRYGEAYRQRHGASLSTAQRRVMTAIELCRTAALGGHIEQCDHCDHQRISYNSCRNRHCGKCQSLARAEWLEDRRSELLDVGYFHVVFTLPEPIRPIAYQNQQLTYNILFRAVSETLRTIAADPKHLGAEIGFFAVLHTWGQNLLHHPHLHCVVPGGGLSPDATRWISCRPDFFLHVRVLRRLFRRLFLKYLEEAFDAGKLQFFSTLEPCRERRAFLRYLAPTRKRKWVVYAKPPFAGPEDVLRYAARYTHRVAISNDRVLDIADEKVRFRWKDYRDLGIFRRVIALLWSFDHSQAAGFAPQLCSFMITRRQSIFGLPRSLQQRQVLGREQLLLHGEASNVAMKLCDLRLEPSDGCAEIGCRRRPLCCGLDLAEQRAMRCIQRIAA